MTKLELVLTAVLSFSGVTPFALASGEAERYGVVGFAFALLTWLFVQSVLIVGAALSAPRSPSAGISVG